MLNADGRRQFGHNFREEARAARFVEQLAARQLVRHGHLIDRFGALPEREAGFEHPPVLVAKEVFGPDDGVDFVDRVVIDHERSDDRFLGLYIKRR